MNIKEFKKIVFILFNLICCVWILPIPFWLGRFYERYKQKNRVGKTSDLTGMNNINIAQNNRMTRIR